MVLELVALSPFLCSSLKISDELCNFYQKIYACILLKIAFCLMFPFTFCTEKFIIKFNVGCAVNEVFGVTFMFCVCVELKRNSDEQGI